MFLSNGLFYESNHLRQQLYFSEFVVCVSGVLFVGTIEVYFVVVHR